MQLLVFVAALLMMTSNSEEICSVEVLHKTFVPYR